MKTVETFPSEVFNSEDPPIPSQITFLFQKLLLFSLVCIIYTEHLLEDMVAPMAQIVKAGNNTAQNKI